MSMSGLSTVLKRGWRNDAFWTSSRIFNSFLIRVPLYFDTRALMKSQYWSREMLEMLRDERLRDVLRTAPHVAYWRELMQRAAIGPEDNPLVALWKLPITSKKELLDQDRRTITDEGLLSKSTPDHTSGSTGRPLHFYFDRHAELRSFAVTERTLRTATDDRRFPVVYMRARHRNGFTFRKHFWFFLRGYNSIRVRLEEFLKLGERFPRGFILYGYTSSVIEIARQLSKRSARLPIKAAMATGEGIRESDRTFIEETFKAPFFHVYASREAGWLAFECQEHRMHMNEEWAYLEIVDNEGRTVPNGTEGSIIVTTFDNRVMPFIRYAIGDRGVISDEPCPCGRTLRTIRILGRATDIIELTDGRTSSLLDISSTFDMFWDTVKQFQLVQKGPLSFDVRVIPGSKFAEMKDVLEGHLVRALHPSVSIQWEIVDSIPEAESGKALYFIRRTESA